MNKINILVFIALGLISCNSDSINPTDLDNGSVPGKVVNGWTVSLDKVQDAGGKDVLSAIENSVLITANEVNFLTDDELVIGIKIGDDIRAYSHRILDQHEVSNETIGGETVTISLCPLTGTSMGWNRTIDGIITTFGVSGLLYNSNLILYDRLTNSNWSQMLSESVNGVQVCNTAITFNVVETSWGTWKSMYPQTLVQSRNTGFDLNYENLPFSSIVPVDASPLFPVSPEDHRLPNYERVHGVIVNGKAKVYRFSNFDEGGGTSLIMDFVESQNIMVVGNVSLNFIVSFIDPNSQGDLDFKAVNNNSDIILEDNEGNRWNVFGEAVSGPREGEKLTTTRSYMGYWFGWAAIFPNPDIFNNQSDG